MRASTPLVTHPLTYTHPVDRAPNQVLTVQDFDSEPKDYFQSPRPTSKWRYYLLGIFFLACGIVAGIVLGVVLVRGSRTCSDSDGVSCPEPQAASKPYSQFLWNENCPDYVAGTRVYLGNGCFWERQYAYSVGGGGWMGCVCL